MSIRAPKKTVIAFRLPPELVKTLTAKARKHRVSRNRVTEYILRDYFAKDEEELKAILDAIPEEFRGERVPLRTHQRRSRLTCSIDDLRAAHPNLGLGVYALEPGGNVTLEIYTPDGEVYTFKALSLGAALLQAFPPESNEPEQADDIFS